MLTARARATATDNRMMTALSKDRGGRNGGIRYGNVGGHPRSTGNLFAAALVALLGIFVATAGIGSGKGLITAIGVGIGVSAAVFGVFTYTQRRIASMVSGTAHIVSATAPPAAATHGRCEMHLVVQAPRLAATAVRHRDQSVPVAKWPTPGGTLPVKVDPEDPRDLRILWDQVRPHGEGPHTEPQHDDLSTLADASGVSTASGNGGPAAAGQSTTATLHETPAPDAAPVIDEPTATVPASLAGTGLDASDADAPVGGLLEVSDEPLDLSFLEPPDPRSIIESDPLLIEYGSPIREVGVTLVVSDIAKALEFYRDVLGFFEIESGPDMVLLEARTGRVVLRQRVDAQAKPPRLMHLTLEVNDIETAHRTLTKRGVEFIDEPRAVLKGELLELWAVSFHDPDGHGVALTSWRPRDEEDSD
ncbi:MAG: hypothetical protein GEU94_00640 [Micromonosporaceae bacterium]|nr:hypothetical protein [Micromonosporaceae bacterium]